MWLLKTQNYALPFVLAGTLYLVGWVVLQLILPRLQVATLTDETKPRVKWWQVIVVCVVLAVTLIAAQSYLNRPPYTSVDDYLQKRSATLGRHELGPAATVGWQDAQWVKWTSPAGETKWELIKLDRHGRPLVEGRGTAAKDYQGPPAAELTGPVPTP